MLISLHASGVGFNLSEYLISFTSAKNIAILLGYLIIFKPASVFIGLILQKYAPPETSDNKGLMAGGGIIGYLERLLILTFIINGQYAVIGFILAAKSIFRFGELNNGRDHNLTEYVLLGPLLSVTITSMFGIFVQLLI